MKINHKTFSKNNKVYKANLKKQFKDIEHAQ